MKWIPFHQHLINKPSSVNCYIDCYKMCIMGEVLWNKRMLCDLEKFYVLHTVRLDISVSSYKILFKITSLSKRPHKEHHTWKKNNPEIYFWRIYCIFFPSRFQYQHWKVKCLYLYNRLNLQFLYLENSFFFSTLGHL